MITLIGMGSGTPGSLTAQGLAALHAVQHLFRIPQRHRHARILGRVLNAGLGLLHQAHQQNRLGAVHPVVQPPRVRRAVVVPDALVLFLSLIHI